MSHKIAIEDVVYLVEKRLGINGVEACEYIYTYLGSEHKSKNITPANLVYLRDAFIKMVDVSKLNNLDYASFLQHTNELIINGSHKASNKEINPPIMFVTMLGK